MDKNDFRHSCWPGRGVGIGILFAPSPVRKHANISQQGQ